MAKLKAAKKNAVKVARAPAKRYAEQRDMDDVLHSLKGAWDQLRPLTERLGDLNSLTHKCMEEVGRNERLLASLMKAHNTLGEQQVAIRAAHNALVQDIAKMASLIPGSGEPPGVDPESLPHIAVFFPRNKPAESYGPFPTLRAAGRFIQANLKSGEARSILFQEPK